jgi:ABC-type nitrate/sulfonate/bicarbonate transport system substrate-binding protein
MLKRIHQLTKTVKTACLTVAAVAVLHCAASAEEFTIHVGYPSGMNGLTAVVLEKSGLGAKHQLKAEFTSFQYGPAMMEGLISGRLDAVVTSPWPPMMLSAKLPGSVTIVASLGQSSHSLLVPKTSSINAWADLRNRKIGVSFNTESHLDLLISLKKAGLDPKTDVELINLLPAELPAAFESGQTDAVVIRQPQVSRLEEKLGARRLETWPFHFISIVRTEYLKQNPEAVKRYVEALADAIFFTASNPEQASVWFGESQRIDPQIVRKASAENPLHAVTRRDELSLYLTPAQQKLVEDRAQAALEQNFIREKVTMDVLQP